MLLCVCVRVRACVCVSSGVRDILLYILSSHISQLLVIQHLKLKTATNMFVHYLTIHCLTYKLPGNRENCRSFLKPKQKPLDGLILFNQRFTTQIYSAYYPRQNKIGGPISLNQWMVGFFAQEVLMEHMIENHVSKCYADQQINSLTNCLSCSEVNVALLWLVSPTWSDIVKNRRLNPS